MIPRYEMYRRRCVDDLVAVIEQVPLRAAARAPLVVNGRSLRWVTLWTLLRWERTFLLVGLEERGVDLDGLTRRLDELLRDARTEDVNRLGEEGEHRPQLLSIPVDVDHLLAPLLDAAAAEARSLGHNYVGNEHLLLALIAGPDDTMASLLADHKLTHALVRAMIAELIPAAEPEEAGTEDDAAPRQWYGRAAGVPRRFGMAIVLLIMTMYAVLFAAMKLLNAHPMAFVMIAVLFTGVGLGQMLLFGGRYPRAASVWTGAVLLPVESVAALIYFSAIESQTPPFQTFVCFPIGMIPAGALAGYLAGGLTAGVFLLLEEWAKRRRQEEEDVDVLAVEDAEDGPSDAPEPESLGETNAG